MSADAGRDDFIVRTLKGEIEKDQVIVIKTGQPLTSEHLEVFSKEAPLQLAMGMGASEALMQTLLSDNPSWINLTEKMGPPLFYALQDKEMSDGTLRLLIDADPSALKARDPHGGLPLHFALVNGASEPVLLQLLSSYPEGAKTSTADGSLPLHIAAQKENASEAVVSKLLELNPDAAKTKNADGSVPAEACLSPNAEVPPLAVFNMVLAANPDAAKSADKDGFFMLHYAAMKGVPREHAALLIETFPDAQTAGNVQGKIPLDFALHFKHKHLVPLLQPPGGRRSRAKKCVIS